ARPGEPGRSHAAVDDLRAEGDEAALVDRQMPGVRAGDEDAGTGGSAQMTASPRAASRGSWRLQGVTTHGTQPVGLPEFWFVSLIQFVELDDLVAVARDGRPQDLTFNHISV